MNLILKTLVITLVATVVAIVINKLLATSIDTVQILRTAVIFALIFGIGSWLLK